MPTRTAQAHWQGAVKEGAGQIEVPQADFSKKLSFASRFEDGSGTNPEELLGAAHAGCYSMALSLMLGEAGYTPEQIQTRADVTIEAQNGGFAITKIKLDASAKIPGIDEATFQEKAQAAKEGCPVSKALAGVSIELDAKLQ